VQLRCHAIAANGVLQLNVIFHVLRLLVTVTGSAKAAMGLLYDVMHAVSVCLSWTLNRPDLGGRPHQTG
jgi:hypothetical protein